MKKKGIFFLIGIIVCLSLGYYFLHKVQTFAQKEKKADTNEIAKSKPIALDEISLDIPMVKEDGMIYYEIFVRSFYDSNGDGIGDINGIVEKLDYIKKLGVNGIWLMPITDSPSYHGYDVTDYFKINSQYGTLEDFKRLTEEAHKKGIKIIMDLVINHTSSEHPWFKEAIKSKDSKYRDYYVWANNKTNLKELNDQNTKTAWEKSNTGYYFAEFWKGMPDLNYDNKKLREEIKKVAKFWLENGVDGFRIDAARHIYQQKRTQDTLLWWKEFGDYVRSINKDTYILGEIWSDEITISRYFKVLNAAFNFPVAKEIVQATRSGNPTQLIRQMDNSYRQYEKINKDYIDSPFLTNHDQNRIMSELQDENKARNAAAIYLTLPGNPTIYYGEELGMKGKKPDEAIREPLKWYKTGGIGQASWVGLLNNGGKEVLAVEEQDNNRGSMLNYYRDLITMRQSSTVLSKGNITVLIDVNKALSYIRSYNGESNLIVHNLKNEKITVDINIPKEFKFEGILIKGKGSISMVENKLSLTLEGNSFVIVR